MTDMFTPQFTDHFDLPKGSFHRRLNYDGNVCDIYFFKQSHGDDFMCRYGDNGPDYIQEDPSITRLRKLEIATSQLFEGETLVAY